MGSLTHDALFWLVMGAAGSGGVCGCVCVIFKRTDIKPATTPLAKERGLWFGGLAHC